MDAPKIPEKPEVKLALCIPSAGEWKADFGMSLLAMCTNISASLFEEGQSRSVIVLDKRTSLLPRSRQECLEDAIIQGATHALFMDTDQSFPQDLAHRLLHWKKPVVACNIPLKVIPSYPSARVESEISPFGMPLDSHGNKIGLEKVWRVGTGIMLIDLAIMKAIEKPWFEVIYNRERAQYQGEDYYFCGKIEAAGHDIYIDHGLSRQIGHTGNFQYTHAHIPMHEALPAPEVVQFQKAA